MGHGILGPGVGAGIPIWQYWWVSQYLLGTAPGPLLQSTHLLFPIGTPLIWESPLLLALGSTLAAAVGPFWSYNSLYLISFPAAGTALYALAKRYGRSDEAAFIGAIAFMFCPPMLTQHLLGQIPETLLFTLPLLLLTLERGNLFFVGLASALACASSPYVGATAGITVAIWAAIDIRRPNLNKLLAAAIAGAVPTILFGYFPILVHAKELTGNAGTYSVSLLSWIDPLAWHPLAIFDRTGIPLEERSVFLGLTIPLLAIGAFRNHRDSIRLFLWLAAAGALLALGPHLRLAYSESPIPLPYALLETLPGFSLFRAPARFASVFWLAAALLAATGFDGWKDRIPRQWRGISHLIVAVIFMLEVGIPWAVRRTTPIADKGVYTIIAEDEGQGAVLEVPVTLHKIGNMSINAQRRMLAAPQHRNPMVAAHLARIPEGALQPFVEQDLLIELTHPHVLVPLENRRDLAARRSALTTRGKESLRELGIEWVIHHTLETKTDEKTHQAYTRLLEDSLGTPISSDAYGRKLYRIPPSF